MKAFFFEKISQKFSVSMIIKVISYGSSDLFVIIDDHDLHGNGPNVTIDKQ